MAIGIFKLDVRGLISNREASVLAEATTKNLGSLVAHLKVPRSKHIEPTFSAASKDVP